MNSYISKGKLVWSSPKIQTQMGAKDALVQIGNLGCGLPDTLAFYSPQAAPRLTVSASRTAVSSPAPLASPFLRRAVESGRAHPRRLQELEAGFKATCAYQPRVIKQNRGSAGEGIWLCWLVDKNKQMVPFEQYPSKAYIGPGKGTLLKVMCDGFV